WEMRDGRWEMSDEGFGAYGHANMIRRAYARVHGRGHASLRDDADVRILRDVLHIRICPTLRQ
ncbi:MAG: hypothetical protein IKJ45_04460, partial [Kiritimatiellae bacterium]|nr:hypothetical protein [Kiritimatiellia bacterium]